MAKTSLGKVGILPKGEYSSATQYLRLDIVSYNGSSYLCIKDCIGIDVTNKEYWLLIAQKGDKGDIGEKGEKGDAGKDFSIYKTYASISAMESDASNVPEGEFVLIASNVEDEDNAKLYVKGEDSFVYLTDLSGATGIKGEKGEKGDKPINGVDYNTPEEKEEFKNEVVSTATTEVKQNIETIKEEAIQEFNSNASTKTNEYNDNTTTKLSEYNTNANSKVEEYNSNATQKTNTFNENATTQTETFNNNATSKTNDFNSNASTKTDEFNTNYEEKLESINEASTSIEQERVISDGKYARALKTPVTDVESTQIYAENDVVDDLVINGVELTQVVTENSPSLDNPSEVQVASEQNIQICQSNIIDTTDVSTKLSGLDFISNSDGGININGTPTSKWTVIKTQNLTVPIKSGTNLYFNYGKTNQLKRDNTDFNVFIRLLDKDNSILYTLNSGFNNTIVEQEIYKIAIGIQGLVLDKSYNEDIYIELEISDEQPTQFQKYESTDITIPLTNSAIGQYADTIDRENNVQNKVIQELILNGNENWNMSDANEAGLFRIYADYISNNKMLCNYFKYNNANTNMFNNLNDGEFGLRVYGTDPNQIFFKYLKCGTIDEWKAKLKELYDAGTPVKVYYVAETSKQEPLSEEVKQELDKFKLYDDLNNVFIDKGSLSFKYNKSLLRAFKEQSELSASLLDRIQALEAAQVNSVGGN